MGTQTWVCITIIVTEVLIVLKFDWDTVTKPFPPEVAFWWYLFIGALVLWTVWQFFLRPFFFSQESKQKKKQ